MVKLLNISAISLAFLAAIPTVNAQNSGQTADPIQEPIIEPIEEPIVEPVGRKVRILLRNFQYLSPHSQDMVPADTMLIENGIIREIGQVEDDCIDCTVMDLEGGYLIPGLIDAHQHLNVGGFAKETTEQKIALLRRNLYWGITTVHNPNIAPAMMRAVQEAVASNPNQFPGFLTSGQNIGIHGGWGNVKVGNFHEFKTAATKQLAQGADSIKVSVDDMGWLGSSKLEAFPPFLLKQAAQLMHTNSRRIYVHTSQLEGLKASVNAEVDAVLHGVIDAPIDQTLINQIKGRNIGYVSTLAWYETMVDARKAVPLMKSFDPDLINGSILYANMSSDLMVVNFRDWWPKSGDLIRRLPIARGNTLALVKAGALVGIGTDAGTPAVIIGASLPYEMYLHEQLGIHPLTVIRLASENNAKILGIDGATGSIEEGKEADMVFLRENPASGIRALNAHAWTMQNGNTIYRPELLAARNQ